jgi:choice-of-anchor B domain-containing protein
MVYLGRLPHYSVPSLWRELRAYKNYMIIGSEAPGHGVQIFDMKKLLTVDPAKPVLFDAKLDLTGHFSGLPNGSTHNIVINEEKNYAVSVGAQPRNSTCKSGLIFIDLSDPSKPTSPGCAADGGYVHDAQCVVYRGPDKRYQGHEICYGYNEDRLAIYDVTDKNSTKFISRISYEGASYVHQGWVLDLNNQEFMVSDDETDEVRARGVAADGYPVTYIWDIRDLENPKQTGYFKSKVKGIDHNQYIVGGLIYQSHYTNGLRVLDPSSIPKDPTGAGVCEVAFFDIHPDDDQQTGGGTVKFAGTWSSYAFLKSGYILINTMERGAFLVKLTSKSCPKA